MQVIINTCNYVFDLYISWPLAQANTSTFECLKKTIFLAKETSFNGQEMTEMCDSGHNPFRPLSSIEDSWLAKHYTTISRKAANPSGNAHPTPRVVAFNQICYAFVHLEY